jgi:ActR/RegA family two-component response regulator
VLFVDDEDRILKTIVRIVLSGYTHITTLLTAINQGEIFRYITKPWEKNEDLVSVILEALEHFEKTAPAPLAATAPEPGV